jgi:predicted acylesterase/phospholipase RssA
MAAYDLVLSSGYLAFARQAGFLSAVESCGVEVTGVCGTSSGALAGAMFAAGHTAREIARELCRDLPITHCRPNPLFWRGAMSLDAMIAHLRTLLPPTFADLDVPLGVGVLLPDGSGGLLTQGPLPEAVAASCAIPYMFAPVNIGGVWYADGGMVDRTALGPWTKLRGPRPALVHLVERSKSGARAETGPHPVVHSPRAGASLLGFGDFEKELADTRARALQVLEPLVAAVAG